MSQEADIKRIMVADDDPVFRDLASTCLKSAGFEVVTADDGAQAIDTLIRHRVDLALIDLVMPRVNGVRLIMMIRATAELRDLPILIITSVEDPIAQFEGMQVGANACMSKPVNWKVFPSIIADLLKSKEEEPKTEPAEVEVVAASAP